MAVSKPTVETVAEFLIKRYGEAEQVRAQVAKVQKDQGPHAVSLIVGNPRYLKSLKTEYLVSELSKELLIPPATLYSFLKIENGGRLAEYGITMREQGNKQLWYYDPSLLGIATTLTPVVQPEYAMPAYPGDTVRPDAIVPSVVNEPQIPKMTATNEEVVGTYHLGAIEVALLRWLHKTSSTDGKVDPRIEYLIVTGIANGFYSFVEREGKEKDIEALKAEIRASIPDTTYAISQSEMYPVVEP